MARSFETICVCVPMLSEYFRSVLQIMAVRYRVIFKKMDNGVYVFFINFSYEILDVRYGLDLDI